MEIIEKKIVSQVNILPFSNTVNVQWSNQILKDDIVIAETYTRKAYSKEQKEEFLDEVENAESYINPLKW